MSMEDITKKLTEYTLALKEALETTNQSNERPLLTNHLAAAAEMYAMLHSSGSAESIHELVKAEVRSHGRSFISGTEGEVLAKKWIAFTNAVGISQ